MKQAEQLIDAAVYVRVSTTKESQRDSPEHQLGICREKARLLGFRQPDELVFEDRDTGTSIVDRLAIKQLMAHAKEGDFKAVIFASLSRFSRDMMDSLMLKRMLVDSLSIRLISIDENFDSYLDNDEFKFQIFAAVNQKQSELISLSSRRGLRQSGLKGNFTGSIAPYGYRKTEINGRKSLDPDPMQQQIVREIFDLYTEHQYGEKAIVKHLNEQGIPSPKRGCWGVTTIQRILQNAVYTGENWFSKYEIVKVHQLEDLHHRKKKLVQRERTLWEQSLQEVTHPPIIDVKVFEKAQQLRLERGGGKRGGVRHKVNVFAGLITCKECSSAMVSVKSRGSNSGRSEYRYLVCSKRRRQGRAGCSNAYWLPYEPFCQEIRKQLAAMMQQLISAEELLERQRDCFDSTSSEMLEQERLQLKISRYREALYRLKKSLLDCELDPKQYEYERERFEQELKRCEQQWEQLESAEGKDWQQSAIEEHARERLEQLLSQAVLSDASVDEEARFIKHWIERIEVNEDGQIKVYLTYRSGEAWQNA